MPVKTFKDHFSAHAADYAKFRPHYPEALFRYLGSVVSERELAWDCATGNGQAAVALAGMFEHVIATDASAKQIAKAEPHARLEYRVASAENSGIDANKVDIITVAQALHWFDLDRFYSEAKRVLNPRGAIAVWAYNLLRIAPEIDTIVNHYYFNVVGSFWPPERALVEKFSELPFPFMEIATPSFDMVVQWNVEHLIGYLHTWSATQRYIAARNCDPLESVADELRSAWGDAKQLRPVAWPLTMRVGRT
jgi:SAM-dependent methyltransferase